MGITTMGKYTLEYWHINDCHDQIYPIYSHAAYTTLDINLLIYFHHKIEWHRISHHLGLNYKCLCKFKKIINWNIFLDENLVDPSYELGVFENIICENPELFEESWGLLSLCYTTINFMIKFRHKMNYYMMNYVGDEFMIYSNGE